MTSGAHMQVDLSNKIAVVTGGSRGLGREMVLAFAKAGADVVIASRKLEACEAVAREIEKLGRRALPLAAHVGKWDDNDKLAEAAYKHFGRVDILVNNAGMSPLAPSLAETSEALFDKVVDVNFKGPFRLSVLVGENMNLFLQQFIGKQSPAQYCSLIKILPRAWRWALLAAPLLALPVPAGAELILANYSASKPLKIMPIGDSITDDCSINGAFRF